MARLWFFMLFVLATPAQAAEFCDISTVLSSYNSALKRKKIGDEEGAVRAFTALAEIGVAPAQRHLAEFYRDESRDKAALEKALMWAQLAAWGGDEEGIRMVSQINDSVRYSVAETGMLWAKEWMPRQSSCYTTFQVEEDDEDLIVVDQYPVLRGDNIEREVFIAFATRLRDALHAAGKIAPQLAQLIQLTPAYEVIEGSGTDRYITWNEEGGRFQVSEGFLEDQGERQLGYSLILAVQRQLYSQMKDAKFKDPLARNFGDIKLVGSIYGDVKTKFFLESFEKALKRAYKLPTILFDRVSQIDEIHYMPPSRYHDNRWSKIRDFALYDYKRSIDGKRIAHVMQRMAFETPDSLVLSLVKLGVQAQQHTMIEGYRNQVFGKNREESILAALQGKGSVVEKAFNNSTAKQKQLVEKWDQVGPDGIPELYCEAAFIQIKAAMALKISENKVTQVVKLKDCKKAREAWRKFKAEPKK